MNNLNIYVSGQSARLVELTDTRHNAHDGIGSGVRLPQGISSAAQI